MTNRPNDHRDDDGFSLHPAARRTSPVSEEEKKPAAKTKTKTRKPHRARRIFLTVLCVILAFILIVAATGVVMYFIGKAHFKNHKIEISAPEEVKILSDDGSEIEYNNENYVYNDNVVSILVLGVDRGSLEEEKIVGTNGQADAIYLCVLDTETKDATILGLSRDTMAQVDVYSTGGQYIGLQTMQVCLAYSYGDGKDSSCENMKNAVARVLYNIPIHSYVTIDMMAIPKLTDIVGGVTVPEYGEDLMTKTGNYIDLNEQNALRYVRERSHETADANNARMERQRNFIDAFSKKFIAQTKDDISTPLSVYNSLNRYDYMVTDVSAAQVTYLAKNFITGVKEVKMLNVPGTSTVGQEVGEGKNYAEFHVDTDALYDIILDLFYIKKD